MDLIRAGEKRYLDLNEMEELRNDAYINSKVAKQRMKKWHDQLISNKEFQKGQRVLLYDTRLHIFPGSSSQESMDIVSSHSWSHSNQKRRKSTSLSHKKPKQRRVEENAKKFKGRNRSEIRKTECKQSKNRGLRDFATSAKLALRCETISQPKRSRCGIDVSLRKRPSFAKSFRSSIFSSAKIFEAASQVWHTSATSQHRSPQFAAAKQ
ncbi:hypothetical protein CK203_102389 [Vitis vinifera]|uniref:Uncharacterized protein n=1 Tax=Vitis vinifera TaxID=29760 RepID=A0A438D9E4_VITVI|nr:hypothetical protein CK203_102389 [Vitis vinifera]